MKNKVKLNYEWIDNNEFWLKYMIDYQDEDEIMANHKIVNS